ncbi:hypothetical protein PtrSN002B_010350 [Pyrenophora tritici-repentis]|uniref:Uncharacterized protein n=2 Tax=Pyrenophora tritici-repentis TaxID=45151 RepID=A0A2W1HXL0_9PLEO|nr:uncharacterized protein PTRG_01749 [Pyrenophora tritici-repentis Pt-1C-BFP]KAA8626446.1 hypothetical protein PtrV1_02126 [Pyrenophora tritici-repentis]EDU41187.1 predicted protein [Pyrenophora tritici-repentis Pt-1C-BFP]KAF7454866.1 hypothetical protein A1F99_021240 [Pyrenophora tritici-repentis]KAF7578012.1 hypothetical protein PtrM4_022520 [Pyrenophora tritici-repentis]KAG9388623.1 hypothetical protein A1F94_001515 [Pyrenophora tritici-repentis]
MSGVVGKRLDKLITGNLTRKEKGQLPYMINSTEKGSSKALLGIRGVEQVLIEGRGHLEAGFAATIRATLTQPPGTDVFETESQDSLFSTPRMNHTGRIPSTGYGPKAHLPYPTTPGTIEYDYSHLLDDYRYLVDGKVEIAGHFSGQSDFYAKNAAVFRAGQDGVARRDVPKIEVGPLTRNRPRRRRVAFDWRHIENLEEEGGQDDILAMEDVVRIKVMKSYPEDYELDNMDSCLLPVLLTSKEGTVEMGWKV